MIFNFMKIFIQLNPVMLSQKPGRVALPCKICIGKVHINGVLSVCDSRGFNMIV